MPIKDLTDSVRLPRLGKVRLGKKVQKIDATGKPVLKDGKPIEYPQKTDYFVFDETSTYYQQIESLYGKEPRALKVMIPVEDPEIWAEQYYKAYQLTRGLVCKGDGELAIRSIDAKSKNNSLPSQKTETVQMVEMNCAGEKCPEYINKDCKKVMHFRFVLYELPGIGIWQIDTSSINSILNINSTAHFMKDPRTFGRVSMIPLTLTLEPAKAKDPGTGKQNTIYVLNLRTDYSMSQLADVAREQAKTLLLEAPDLEAVYEEQVESDIDALFGEETNANANRAREDAEKAYQERRAKAQPVDGELVTEPEPTITDEEIKKAQVSGEESRRYNLSEIDDIITEIKGWTEKTAVSWINSQFKVGLCGYLHEALDRCTDEQIKQFTDHIQELQKLK